MKQIDTIRAALELSSEFLAQPQHAKQLLQVMEALAALAELEKAAAEPVAWMYDKGDEEGLVTPFNPLTTPGHGGRKNIRPLYAAPPAPVAEIREVVVTRPMCHGAWARFWSEPNNGDSCDQALRWLEAWRSELGPALGLAEIREPTPEECADIAEWFKSECEACCINPQESADYGRAIFDAVKIVMWPKEGL